MSQLKNVVDPFGEVNVYPAGRRQARVVATILMEPHKEGAQTGIALDGSGSMAKLYGVEDGSRRRSVADLRRPRSSRTTRSRPSPRSSAPTSPARSTPTAAPPASTGPSAPGGSQIEVIGDLTADQAEQHVFGPPRDFGTGTQLLPAVSYFVDRFRDAPWGFYVFITDGELHDLDAVKALQHAAGPGRVAPAGASRSSSC